MSNEKQTSNGKDYSHSKVNNPRERKCVECNSLELTVTDDAGIDDEIGIAADIFHECGCVYT